MNHTISVLFYIDIIVYYKFTYKYQIKKKIKDIY